MSLRTPSKQNLLSNSRDWEGFKMPDDARAVFREVDLAEQRMIEQKLGRPPAAFAGRLRAIAPTRVFTIGYGVATLVAIAVVPLLVLAGAEATGTIAMPGVAIFATIVFFLVMFGPLWLLNTHGPTWWRRFWSRQAIASYTNKLQHLQHQLAQSRPSTILSICDRLGIPAHAAQTVTESRVVYCHLFVAELDTEVGYRLIVPSSIIREVMTERRCSSKDVTHWFDVVNVYTLVAEYPHLAFCLSDELDAKTMYGFLNGGIHGGAFKSGNLKTVRAR